MPRSKDPTPQASLFDPAETATNGATPPSALESVRGIVADVAHMRKVIRELENHVSPQQESDA